DRPGRDAVHPDTLGPVVDGHRLRQRDDRALRDGIGGETAWTERGDRRHVDDGAAARPPHRGDRVLRGEKHRVDVDGHQPVPALRYVDALCVGHVFLGADSITGDRRPAQPSDTRRTLIECAGNSCSNRWPRVASRASRTSTAPGVSNELVASTPAPLTSETSTSSFLLIVFLVANRRIVEGVRVSALKG